LIVGPELCAHLLVCDVLVILKLLYFCSIGEPFSP
jgi:hypothetical protein